MCKNSLFDVQLENKSLDFGLRIVSFKPCSGARVDIDELQCRLVLALPDLDMHRVDQLLPVLVAGTLRARTPSRRSRSCWSLSRRIHLEDAEGDEAVINGTGLEGGSPALRHRHGLRMYVKYNKKLTYRCLYLCICFYMFSQPSWKVQMFYCIYDLKMN